MCGYRTPLKTAHFPSSVVYDLYTSDLEMCWRVWSDDKPAAAQYAAQQDRISNPVILLRTIHILLYCFIKCRES